MSGEQIRAALFECIRDVQVLSGKAVPELTLDTCPFYDLDAFDSLLAVETTELLSARLHTDIRCGKGDVNLFVSKDGRKPLKLAQVIERLESLIIEPNGK